MLRTKPDGKGGYDENSFRSSDETNAIRWDKLSETDYSKTVEYYRGLIAFRKAHGSLHLRNRSEVVNTVQPIPNRNPYVVIYRVLDDEQDIFFIFNAGADAVSVKLPSGNWDLMIHDDMAGTNVLGEKDTVIEAAPISASVLTQAK